MSSATKTLFLRIQRAKSRRKSVEPLRKKIRKSWIKFCDETKLAGLNLIGGTLNSTRLDRMILMTVWVVCFSLFLVKCHSSIVDYLQYDAQTTFQYNPVDRLKFPAVTFCNVNELRKSVLGTVDVLLLVMSGWMSERKEDIQPTYQRNLRTCKVTETDTVGGNAIRDALWKAVQTNDYPTIYKKISVDSNLSVNKCWWNNRERNCSNFFINHPVDNKMCFTFNQDPAFVDFGQWTNVYAVYGAENQTLKTATSFAPRYNGLKLLLNARQEEYCSSAEWTGAGFYTIVHDPNTMSSLNIETMLYLSPGFEYRVTMRPVTFDRRNFSEWLGRCTTYVYNFLKPTEKRYSQKTCFAWCIAKKMFENCGCLPIIPNSTLESRSTAQFLNTKLEKLKACDMIADEWCTKKQFYKFINNAELNSCPQCKSNCLETKYKLLVSATKLSERSVKRFRSNDSSSESLRKNLLLVSFGFDEMNLLTVTDSQEITALELFISVSGTLGLFLGCSVVTFYEITHQLLITFSICFTHFFRATTNSTNFHQRPKMFLTSLKNFWRKHCCPICYKCCRRKNQVGARITVHVPQQTE